MSILIYAESWEGKFKKSVYEAISYAKETAKKFNLNLVALSIGEVEENELKSLAEYGVDRIISSPPIIKADGQEIAIE